MIFQHFPAFPYLSRRKKPYTEVLTAFSIRKTARKMRQLLFAKNEKFTKYC